MAADLAGTPKTGLHVEAGGRWPCQRFLVSRFRRNSSSSSTSMTFDETLHAPWEWDVKRLATVFVLTKNSGMAGRTWTCLGGGSTLQSKAIGSIWLEYARMRALEVWYSQLNAEILIEEADTASAKKYWGRAEDKARLQTSPAGICLPRITKVVDAAATHAIIDIPPLVYHPRQMIKLGKRVRGMFHRYRLTLPEERRVILETLSDAWKRPKTGRRDR